MEIEGKAIAEFAKFDDGREVELLNFVYGKEDIEKLRNNPSRVLEAIDEYARTKRYLMNVGEDKGKIVTDLIAQVKPKVMVEFGGYVAYSAILFGDALRRAGGQRYWVLERSPEFAAVIMALTDLAGLRDTVRIVVGPSDQSIKRLHTSGALEHIDMAFIDHYKPAYLTDLKLCEELKLVTPGTVLTADNVVHPGNPPYLEYVRSTTEEKKQAVKNKTSNGVNGDFPDWSANQYKDKKGIESVNLSQLGNPNLVYESQLINSFEPNGIPVSLF